MSIYNRLCIIYSLRKILTAPTDSPSRNLLECYNPLPDRNNGMDRMDNTYRCASSRDGRDIRAEKSIRKLDSVWSDSRTLVKPFKEPSDTLISYLDLIKKQGIPAVSPNNIPSLEK